MTQWPGALRLGSRRTQREKAGRGCRTGGVHSTNH
jgi:hypothetical protein